MVLPHTLFISMVIRFVFFMKPIQSGLRFRSHLLIVFRAKKKYAGHTTYYAPFARKEMNNVILLILLFRRLVFDQKSPVHLLFFYSGLRGLL